MFMLWTHVMARVACWWYWSLDMTAWKHEHRHLQKLHMKLNKKFGHKRYECAQPVQLILNSNLHLQIIMHHVPWSYSHTCILQELKFPAPTLRTKPWRISVVLSHLGQIYFFCTILFSESHKEFSFFNTRNWVVHTYKDMRPSYKEINCSQKETIYSYMITNSCAYENHTYLHEKQLTVS